ncbi:MAG: peptide-N-glycosidase F-related protein, partial [Chitinophagales bacterium]
FRFIEGVPAKRVRNIQKVYGGGTYNNSAQFESDVVPPKNLDIEATFADLRMIVTGHKQDGEFTPIKYQVNANSTFLREELLWRDDCSENPLSPQGGTWIYNRANWCPGDAVEEHWFDLSDYVQNGSLALDVDFDAYTPPNGEASYTISGYVFEYQKIQRLYDVVLDRIVTPSIDSELKTISSTNSTFNFDRYAATICKNPMVRIKNMGNKTLNYCQIEYGVIGGFSFYYEWQGSLEFGESEEVELPIMDWSGLDTNNPVFFAEVSFPNQLVDQFQHNNRKESSFELPQVFADGNLTLRLRTNNQPQENSYTLIDDEGNVILDEQNFSGSSNNDKTVTLQNGCYKLEVLDTDNFFFGGSDIGGDGLSYWVNTQNNLETAGFFEIRQTGGGRLLYFDPDFGHKITYEFMVGEALHQQSNPPLPGSEPEHADVEEVTINGVNYYHMPDSGLYFTEVGVGSTPEEALNIAPDAEIDPVQISVFPNP